MIKISVLCNSGIFNNAYIQKICKAAAEEELEKQKLEIKAQYLQVKPEEVELYEYLLSRQRSDIASLLAIPAELLK